MQNFVLEKKLGKDLTQAELDTINKYRKKEFDHQKSWTKEKLGLRKGHLFFLLRDENSALLAFCRLRPIELIFMNNQFNILGLSTVISTEKGKGYGKALMKHIIEYVVEQGKTMIGFCEAKNRGFYLKSGLKIIEDGCLRFIYVNKQGRRIGDDGDVIYLEGKDGFVEEIMKYPTEKVISNYVPHW